MRELDCVAQMLGIVANRVFLQVHDFARFEGLLSAVSGANAKTPSEPDGVSISEMRVNV